jgi:hypothetical protein
MGWGDLGIFGNPSGGSPNLDKMGRDGMVLTDAYSANPLCSPCKFQGEIFSCQSIQNDLTSNNTVCITCSWTF